MELDNQVIGKNIARLRKLKDIKAFDMAERLGMKEAAYTKYERGETSITLDFVQKVSQELDVDPITMLTTTPANIFENFTNSPVAINGNSTLHTIHEQQTLMMIKLMESIVSMNEKIVLLLQSKG